MKLSKAPAKYNAIACVIAAIRSEQIKTKKPTLRVGFCCSGRYWVSCPANGGRTSDPGALGAML